VHPRNGAANIPFDHEVDLLPALEPDWTCPIVPGAIGHCEEEFQPAAQRAASG